MYKMHGATIKIIFHYLQGCLLNDFHGVESYMKHLSEPLGIFLGLYWKRTLVRMFTRPQWKKLYVIFVE